LQPLLPGALPAIRPVRTAAIFAVLYLATCLAYIWISGRIAAGLAQDVSDLQRLEAIKGSVFVIVTTTLCFVAAWWLLVRIADREATLASQRSALAASERRAAAALFAASTAHDMNNMLFVAGGQAEVLQEQSGLSETDRRAVSEVSRAIHELSRLARNLVEVGSSGRTTEAKDVDLAALVREAVDFARVHRSVRHCQLSVDAPVAARLRAEPSVVTQCLLNLVLNAADATGGRGRIEIRILPAPESSGFVLEVHDDGPGIPAADRVRVIEPFYTTKPAGSGLGLLSAKVCAEEHGGRLEIGDSPLGGACVRVTLRGATAPAPPPSASPAR
jgi:signal transduction histidine kinase